MILNNISLVPLFQSLDEDYNILSKLKKSSKNVHAAGLSMFLYHLVFLLSFSIYLAVIKTGLMENVLPAF